MGQHVESLAPGLYRWHSRPAGPHEPVNSYVIAEAEGTTLVDPAHDLSSAAVAALGLAPVKRILITHLQREHVAGCVHFPDIPVHVPAGDVYLGQGPAAYEACLTTWPEPWDWKHRGNARGHIAGAANERPSDVPLNLAAPLTPGECAHGFDVIATAGHGKHAVTLLKRIDGRIVAFCGDLVYGDGRLWNWFDAEWDYGPQTGQRALRRSIDNLLANDAHMLCPSHGPVISHPAQALRRLRSRLDDALAPLHRALESAQRPEPITAPQPLPGWTRVLPSLYQWQAHGGNCNVLLSETGHALLVDDGLCTWLPLPERRAHHQRTIAQLKRALGIDRIEMVIPTHYHGDHTEHIPQLIEQEPARVIALDLVAEPIEHPERFNLACRLPWYGTEHDAFPVHEKVSDGQRIRWHEYELEFFHLGGQTYYHAGIATRIDGHHVVFAGDAIGSPEPGCLGVICYNDAEPQTRGWAYAMQQLLQHPADVLVLGHGLTLKRPRPLLEANHDLWQQRLAQFAALNPHDSLRRFFDPFLKHDEAQACGHERGFNCGALPDPS